MQGTICGTRLKQSCHGCYALAMSQLSRFFLGDPKMIPQKDSHTWLHRKSLNKHITLKRSHIPNNFQTMKDLLSFSYLPENGIHEIIGTPGFPPNSSAQNAQFLRAPGRRHGPNAPNGSNGPSFTREGHGRNRL
jgi:hypothetical protein